MEPNQPSGSHDEDIINNESEIIPEQSDVTAETEDKSLDGDCTSEDPVEPRTVGGTTLLFVREGTPLWLPVRGLDL